MKNEHRPFCLPGKQADHTVFGGVGCQKQKECHTMRLHGSCVVRLQNGGELAMLDTRHGVKAVSYTHLETPPASDFEAMQELTEKTGCAAPAALSSLRTLPVRFTEVIAPAAIRDAALR